jgi:hypothetical protein
LEGASEGPFSWPKSSEAISDSGIAAQLTRMNGRFARLDLRYRARQPHRSISRWLLNIARRCPTPPLVSVSTFIQWSCPCACVLIVIARRAQLSAKRRVWQTRKHQSLVENRRESVRVWSRRS